MRPKWHILFGFVISYILIYFFNFSLYSGIIIFLSSFLIDLDHYFLYLFETKRTSLKEAYYWCISEGIKFSKLSKEEKRKYKLRPMIFHGIEFMIILALLATLNKVFLWILIGVIIHLFADIPDLIEKQFPVYSKLSQVYLYITNKKKKLFIS